MTISNYAENRSCLKCKATQTRRWQTGPDGMQSLCAKCHKDYRLCEMVIFKDKKGIYSVLKKTGTKPVRVVGFRSTRPSGNKNYLLPITKSIDTPPVTCPSEKIEEEETSPPKPAQAFCLRCNESCTDQMHLGPDGRYTLCLMCHRRYSCRELPLFKNQSGSISVTCNNGARRVDHVGFHLKGMQRDLTQPITKPWLGRARETATILTTRKMHDWTKETSRRQNIPFKFQKVQPHRNPAPLCNDQNSSTRRNDTSADGSLCVQAEKQTTLSDELLLRLKRRSRKLLGTTLTSCKGADARTGSQPHGPIVGSLLGSNITRGLDNSCSLNPNDPGGLLFGSSLPVKASCRIGGSVIIRRFSFQLNRQPEDFIEDLSHIFGLQTDFFIRYRDNANDEITVSTRTEVFELFAIAMESRASPVVIEVIPIPKRSLPSLLSNGFFPTSSDAGRDRSGW